MDHARERFAGLDLMRGFAALAVLSLHVPHAPGAGPLLPRAYLAVDFFFALSGFVLAHAYGARLGRDIGPVDFLRIRVRRLYPLYVIALIAGAMLMFGDVVGNAHPARAVGDWAGALSANFLFLPAPPPVSGPEGLLFPAVGAAWSLFWELAANLLYALLVRFAPRVLPFICPCALLVLAAAARHSTLDGGAHWAGFMVGGVRVCWAFFLGVTLQRIVKRQSGNGRLHAAVGWAAASTMILLFAVHPTMHTIRVYDLGFVTIVVPLLVLVGARAALDGPSARFAAWLGGISYAVYILQSPVLKMLETLTSAAGVPLTEIGWVWASAICVGGTLSMAWIVQEQLASRSYRGTRLLQTASAEALTTTSPAAQ